MQSPTQNQTRSYARYRLLSSLGGKLADAIGVIITIKTLAAAEYGVIGTALGLMAVVGFLNLTPEDVLWRDLPRLRDKLSEHLAAFVWFWRLKFFLVAGVAIVFCALYGATHQSGSISLAVLVIVLLLQLLSISTLAEVPLFAGLQQRSGATFTLGVRLLWLAMLVPNFWFRSLNYYLIALATYATVTAGLAFWLLKTRLSVTFKIDTGKAWATVRDAAMDLTLWLHLSGRARAFLQRGDLAILGGMGVSLAALGGYTVAINLVTFAFLVPGVFENVAAVSFAHDPQRRAANLRKYLGITAGLSAAQFVGGMIFGKFALQLLRVQDIENTYLVFQILLAGTSILTAAGPTVAYAMCFRPMRELFARVFLPAAALYALTVWLLSAQAGMLGAALGHATLCALTGVGMILYVWVGRDEETKVGERTAEAESTFQE